MLHLIRLAGLSAQLLLLDRALTRSELPRDPRARRRPSERGEQRRREASVRVDLAQARARALQRALVRAVRGVLRTDLLLKVMRRLPEDRLSAPTPALPYRIAASVRAC
jgi:hypothetical protein